MKQLSVLHRAAPIRVFLLLASAALSLGVCFPASGASQTPITGAGSSTAPSSDANTAPQAGQPADTSRDAVCRAQSTLAQHAMWAGDAARSVAALDMCLTHWGPEIASQATVADSALIADMDTRQLFPRVNLILLQRERRRYALVGHPLPVPIAARYWVNAPSDTTRATVMGPLTLIEFVAPGCAGCDSAQAIVRRLAAQYRDRGLRVLVVTLLNGKTPAGDSVTVEQELAYTRTYWSDRLGPSVPVAVARYSHEDDMHLVPRPALFVNYGATGSPTYFLVDRRGIIRYAMEGRDPDLEAHLSAAIARMP